jgi:tetratricopeptide (TPR) repeat protein
LVLEEIVEHWPGDSRAWYYLGNHHYDARRHDEAIVCWEKARTLDAQFPTCRRNLALAYFNKRGEPEAALRELEAAFDLNPQDVRVFFELDQLRKKMNVPPGDRRRVLADHPALVIQRDSLYLEWVALHNRMGQYKEALGLLGARHFHPWEGGEGRVSEQYQFAQVQIARQALAVGDGCRAVVQLEAARAWPEQLGEGRLTGIQENHIDYYLGLAQVQRGEVMAAREAFERAASGFEHLSMSMFYYDQPPDMLYYQGLALKKLGREREAMSRFNRLIDHGERHLHDACTIDYFAISLPNFLVFDDDLNLRNRVHCLYLMALGHAGKGNMSKAEARAREVLALDVNHLGAWALLPESLIAS